MKINISWPDYQTLACLCNIYYSYTINFIGLIGWFEPETAEEIMHVIMAFIGPQKEYLCLHWLKLPALQKIIVIFIDLTVWELVENFSI